MDQQTIEKLDAKDYHEDIIDAHREYLTAYYCKEINIVTLMSLLGKTIEVDNLVHFGSEVVLELLNRSHRAVSKYQHMTEVENEQEYGYNEWLGMCPIKLTRTRYTKYLKILDKVRKREEKLAKRDRRWKI